MKFHILNDDMRAVQIERRKFDLDTAARLMQIARLIDEVARDMCDRAQRTAEQLEAA